MKSRSESRFAPDAAPPADAPRRRAPYRSPRILYRERLETVASICSPGKAFGQSGPCASIISS